MLEDAEQLVDGVRAERVQHVGPVEGDPDRAVRLRAVVGEVGQVLEAWYVVPGPRVEGLRHSVERSHGATVPHAQPTDPGRAGRGAGRGADRVTPGRAAGLRPQVLASQLGTRGRPPAPPATGSTPPTTWSSSADGRTSLGHGRRQHSGGARRADRRTADPLGGAAGAGQRGAVGRVLRPDLGAAGPAGRGAGRGEQGAGARPGHRCRRAGLGHLQPAGRRLLRPDDAARRPPAALARRRCPRRGGLARGPVGRAERRGDAARLVRRAGRAQRDAGRGDRDDPRPGAEQPARPDRRDRRRGADHRRRRRHRHRGGDRQHRGRLPGDRGVPAGARDPVLAVVERPGAAARGAAAVRRTPVPRVVLDLTAAPSGLRLGMADPVPGQPRQRAGTPLSPLLPAGRDRLQLRRGREPGLRAHRGLRRSRW